MRIFAPEIARAVLSLGTPFAERKVRAARATMLPNGKAAQHPKVVPTESATEKKPPERVRVKTRGKIPRHVPATGAMASLMG